MKKLDRSRPVGQTFGQDSATLPFIQDGLYFDVRGELIDCPYNREKDPSAFEADKPNAPVPDELENMKLLMDSKTAAEIYTGAVKLRETLDTAGEVDDPYVPDPSNKEHNIDFILRHAKPN